VVIDMHSHYMPRALLSALGKRAAAPRTAERDGKMYVESVCNWPPAVRFSMDFFGTDRIMLGTDHPFWPMPAAIQTLDQAGLSGEERAMIEHENAARIFGLHGPATERR
jgi:predicted TIM-barrel fold metal-dependent hydrolase